MDAVMDDLDLRMPGRGPGEAPDAARLLAALPEAVLVLRAGHVTFANEAARTLFGGDPTDAPLGVVIDGWDDETGPPPELAFARLPGEGRLPVELKVADAGDGRTIVVLRDAGALLSALEAEEARARAEERYRALVEQIPAVVYADEGGERTTYVNPQIERILGVTPERYLAEPDLWLRMVHPEDRARVEAESDAFIRGEGGDLADYRMIRPDGRVVWIRDRAYAQRDEHGRVIWEHGILFDVTELKEAEARIAYMAFHDALTGLANRALFEESLGLAIGRAQRSDLGVAVLFLDLDNFKDVNDSLGHHAGDELLAELAGRLRTAVRDSDLVARQGGDEFLMLLGDLEEPAAVETATQVAERVEDVLRIPFVLQDEPVEARGSIGISLYPTDAEDAGTLMKQADAAMYRAKRAARGSHAFWSLT
jgi:diguanylate cyclase (GGDEF)-like protein/PAS domain S-box-containing protein